MNIGEAVEAMTIAIDNDAKKLAELLFPDDVVWQRQSYFHIRAYGDQRRRFALQQAAKFASDLWEPYTVAEPYRAGQLDMALHISTGILSLIPEEPHQ